MRRWPPKPDRSLTPPDDLVRLRHLRDAAEKAIAYTEGRTRRDLEDDELLQLALTKLVEIVGEAAKQVSAATQGEHPDVAWSAAARMRDRRVHHYFDIDRPRRAVEDGAGKTAGPPGLAAAAGGLIRAITAGGFVAGPR